MIVTIDTRAELKKQGLAFDIAPLPEPPIRVGRTLYYRINGDSWEASTGAYGDRSHTASEAVAPIIADLERLNVEIVEIASKPSDSAVYVTISPPTTKGAAARQVLFVEPSNGRSTVGLFRSLKRTLWQLQQRHQRPVDIYDLDPNGGQGKCLWRAPRDLDVPLPVELQGKAPDRIAWWERIAERMASEALESTPWDRVDTARISADALGEYHETFQEADLPRVVRQWSEPAQAVYRELHEGLCQQGLLRHSTAAHQALQAIAREKGDELERDIVAGSVQL